MLEEAQTGLARKRYVTSKEDWEKCAAMQTKHFKKMMGELEQRTELVHKRIRKTTAELEQEIKLADKRIKKLGAKLEEMSHAIKQATAPAEVVNPGTLSDALEEVWEEERPNARAQMICVDKHPTAPAEGVHERKGDTADPRPWSPGTHTCDLLCPRCGRSAEVLSKDGAAEDDTATIEFGCPVHGAEVDLIEKKCPPRDVDRGDTAPAEKREWARCVERP